MARAKILSGLGISIGLVQTAVTDQYFMARVPDPDGVEIVAQGLAANRPSVLALIRSAERL
jgi:hypothetical protein